MKKRKRYCLIICFSFLCFCAGGQNCQQTIKQADSFYQLNQNDIALRLLERASYFKCDGDYNLLLANLYFETEDYFSALQKFEKEVQSASSIEKKQNASIGIIKSYVQLEMLDKAINSLNTSYSSSGDSVFKQRLGLYYFITYWKMGQLDSAEKWSLTCVANDSNKQSLAKQYFVDYKRKKKQPNLALIMNLAIPGSGFVYTKNYGRAAKSFVLNTVLAASTIYTAGQYYPAFALVAVGSWWVRYYAGGLINGYNSAVYYNRNQKDIWKEKILALMANSVN